MRTESAEVLLIRWRAGELLSKRRHPRHANVEERETANGRTPQEKGRPKMPRENQFRQTTITVVAAVLAGVLGFTAFSLFVAPQQAPKAEQASASSPLPVQQEREVEQTSTPSTPPVATQQVPEVEQVWAPALPVQVETISHPVNQKHVADEFGDYVPFGSAAEIATCRFVLLNPGKSPITLTKGEFLVDSVTKPVRVTNEVRIEKVDPKTANAHLHAGHVVVILSEPRVNDVIDFPLNLPMPPGAKQEFTLRFKLGESSPMFVFGGIGHLDVRSLSLKLAQEVPALLFLSGRFRVHSESIVSGVPGPTSDPSEPVELEIHRRFVHVKK